MSTRPRAKRIASTRSTAPLSADEIKKVLDGILGYHLNMIMSYEERSPFEELHKSHQGDPFFEIFGMTDVEFTRKRWYAGFANACATNLGRFTDKATKTLLTAASGLPPEKLLRKVTIRSNDAAETEEMDSVLMLDEVSASMRPALSNVIEQLSSVDPKPFAARGIAFELRGRYGKNDDTLIQKDEHMASAMRELGAIPVLGIFSTVNAPQAIARLKRSWVIRLGAVQK